MKHIKVLASMAVVVLFASCGEPQESAAMKEAKAVHEQLTRISGELHESLMVAMAPLEDKIDSAIMAGDTLLAAELAKVEGKLDRIDVRFHDWSETVVEIPGQACNHDHGHEGHDHGDHEGQTMATTRAMTTKATTTRDTTMTMVFSCRKASATRTSLKFKRRLWLDWIS